MAYFDNLEVLPIFQNIASPSDQLFTAEASSTTPTRALAGRGRRREGDRLGGWLPPTAPRGAPDPRGPGQLDLGIALPVPHMSLWLRTAAGIASGDLDDPLATVYFGGFGNNYVDDHPVQRYLEWTSFPGFPLNALEGRSFLRVLTEAKLPPLIFQRVGTPVFFLNWLRPEMFAAVLVTDPERGATRGTQASIGAQIDLRFSVLHWYEMTLSGGFAVGLREWQNASHEWMVSLKIL